MSSIDLDAIRQRADRYAAVTGHGARDFLAAELAADVPDLLAEIGHLRRELDTMTQVARGNKRHVATLVADIDRMQAQIDRQIEWQGRYRDVIDALIREVTTNESRALENARRLRAEDGAA